MDPPVFFAARSPLAGAKASSWIGWQVRPGPIACHLRHFSCIRRRLQFFFASGLGSLDALRRMRELAIPRFHAAAGDYPRVHLGVAENFPEILIEEANAEHSMGDSRRSIVVQTSSSNCSTHIKVAPATAQGITRKLTKGTARANITAHPKPIDSSHFPFSSRRCSRNSRSWFAIG